MEFSRSVQKVHVLFVALTCVLSSVVAVGQSDSLVNPEGGLNTEACVAKIAKARDLALPETFMALGTFSSIFDFVRIQIRDSRKRVKKELQNELQLAERTSEAKTEKVVEALVKNEDMKAARQAVRSLGLSTRKSMDPNTLKTIVDILYKVDPKLAFKIKTLGEKIISQESKLLNPNELVALGTDLKKFEIGLAVSKRKFVRSGLSHFLSSKNGLRALAQTGTAELETLNAQIDLQKRGVPLSVQVASEKALQQAWYKRIARGGFAFVKPTLIGLGIGAVLEVALDRDWMPYSKEIVGVSSIAETLSGKTQPSAFCERLSSASTSELAEKDAQLNAILGFEGLGVNSAVPVSDKRKLGGAP